MSPTCRRSGDAGSPRRRMSWPLLFVRDGHSPCLPGDGVLVQSLRELGQYRSCVAEPGVPRQTSACTECDLLIIGPSAYDALGNEAVVVEETCHADSMELVGGQDSSVQRAICLTSIPRLPRPFASRLGQLPIHPASRDRAGRILSASAALGVPASDLGLRKPGDDCLAPALVVPQRSGSLLRIGVRGPTGVSQLSACGSVALSCRGAAAAFEALGNRRGWYGIPSVLSR